MDLRVVISMQCKNVDEWDMAYNIEKQVSRLETLKYFINDIREGKWGEFVSNKQ